MLLSLFLRRFFFGPLVLLITVSAACASASTPTPTPTPTPTHTPTPLTPLEILQQSHERSKNIKSFRSHLDLEISVLDERVVMIVDMEMGKDGRMRNVMDIDTPDGKQSIEMIVAGPYVYLKDPDAGWTQVSAEAIARSAGQSLDAVSDPTAFYSNVFPAQDVPWDLYAVKSLGREELDGIQTEHLNIQAEFQEIWQHLDDDQKRQFLQAIPDPEVAMEEVIEGIRVKGVEVWIDDRGYSRRTIMEIIFSGEGITSLDGEMSMKMDMRIFDINEEITIKLPEGYEDFETATGLLETTEENSAYEKLLALIPDSPDTRASVFLNDYVLLRKNLTMGPPSPNPKAYFESLFTTLSERGVLGMGRAPFISGYTEFAVHTFEMGKYLAFDLRTLDQSVLAGTPPGQLGAMLGDFDPTATDAALENCVASVPDCAIAIHQSHEGISFYSWGEDLAMDLTRVLVPPAFDRLGRGGRIAVQDSHVFYTVETPGMEALIETSLAKRPSLLDSKQFRLLAKAITQLDAHASFLSDQTMSVEDAIDKIGGKNMSQEHVEQIRAQVMATPMLKPYLAFATGEGVDQVGPYMALALVHANAETAEENVNLLLRRINEASSLMTRQQWAEMVDRTEVRADGPILLAKLHG